MQREPSIHSPLRKRPHDDIGLESHVGSLSGGQEGARGGAGEAGDAAGVTGEEGLLAGREVLDDDLAAKGVDNVFAIGMTDQTTRNVTCKYNAK